MIRQKISHYRLVRDLCWPGLGGDFLARDTESRRAVSLEVLPPEWTVNEENFRVFTAEMWVLAALDHPNLAKVYDVGEDAGRHFVAVEPVAGPTLYELMRGGKSNLRERFDLLRQVAEGLAAAHKTGVLHLGLTPHHVLIPRDGPAKIRGFGLARLSWPGCRFRVDEGSKAAPAGGPKKAGRRHEQLVYSLEDASPEKVRLEQIDARHDIFLFGLIFYEAVTGRPAFTGESPNEALNRLLQEPPPPIKEFNPEAPREAQVIAQRCLAKDPYKRYPMIKDAAVEIKNLLSGLA